MKMGLIVDGEWLFIHELLADWQDYYDTEIFEFQERKYPISAGRINRWRFESSLEKFLKNKNVVFFEWAGPKTIIGSRMVAEKPTIVRLHSHELFAYAPKIFWDNINCIVLVSKAIEKKFLSLYPSTAGKTKVIPCGKSMSTFKMEYRTFRGNMAMLCELVPIKRVYEMILTLYLLKQKGCSLTLHLGGKPLRGVNNQRYFISLQRAVEKLSLNDQVVFHGWIDDVPSWLNKMDIFISNSYWEGQQNALIEAMAAGCYCLSHFWDGAEEILPRRHIYSTDNELQDLILEYCGLNEVKRKEHINRLREIAHEKFDIDKTKIEFRKIIDEL
jgi:glycosyltransferase involved in cell wall biosynthesis